RGLISRPTVAETYRFRDSIDECVIKLLEEANETLLAEIEPILTLGLHHEQQHQELLVTDIKHVFSQNPLHPVFRPAKRGKIDIVPPKTAPMNFVAFDEAIVEIGFSGTG